MACPPLFSRHRAQHYRRNGTVHPHYWPARPRPGCTANVQASRAPFRCKHAAPERARSCPPRLPQGSHKLSTAHPQNCAFPPAQFTPARQHTSRVKGPFAVWAGECSLRVPWKRGRVSLGWRGVVRGGLGGCATRQVRELRCSPEVTGPPPQPPPVAAAACCHACIPAAASALVERCCMSEKLAGGAARERQRASRAPPRRPNAAPTRAAISAVPTCL